ncbi:unnamed protein product [Linum trigynum]|uniref:Uncharacterized protein n=1 Tax=Linum trigynum TaxID=586398 RepID=A0AAV2CJ49_9ROSI
MGYSNDTGSRDGGRDERISTAVVSTEAIGEAKEGRGTGMGNPSWSAMGTSLLPRPMAQEIVATRRKGKMSSYELSGCEYGMEPMETGWGGHKSEGGWAS